jgi:hypothetical protein
VNQLVIRPEGATQLLIGTGPFSKRIVIENEDITRIFIDVRRGVTHSTSKKFSENREKRKLYFRRSILKNKQTSSVQSGNKSAKKVLVTKYRKSSMLRARHSLMDIGGLRVQHGHKITYDEHGNTLLKNYYKYGQSLGNAVNANQGWYKTKRGHHFIPKDFRIDNVVFRDRKLLTGLAAQAKTSKEFLTLLEGSILKIPTLGAYLPSYTRVFDVFKEES